MFQLCFGTGRSILQQCASMLCKITAKCRDNPGQCFGSNLARPLCETEGCKISSSYISVVYVWFCCPLTKTFCIFFRLKLCKRRVHEMCMQCEFQVFIWRRTYVVCLAAFKSQINRGKNMRFKEYVMLCNMGQLG